MFDCKNDVLLSVNERLFVLGVVEEEGVQDKVPGVRVPCLTPGLGVTIGTSESQYSNTTTASRQQKVEHRINVKGRLTIGR